MTLAAKSAQTQSKLGPPQTHQILFVCEFVHAPSGTVKLLDRTAPAPLTKMLLHPILKVADEYTFRRSTGKIKNPLRFQQLLDKHGSSWPINPRLNRQLRHLALQSFPLDLHVALA